MKLYLLRHGHAPAAHDAGVATDDQRPLSDEGREGVRLVAGELRKRGGRPGLILHSPLRRAKETAEVAQAVLKPVQGARLFNPLANAMPASALLDELRPELDRTHELLAVGHQPQLGELASLLCGRVFELRPGGLIAIELSDGAAQTLWACNPSDFGA
ncbi:MAG: phosphohistidine phosphatase SixA [Elusimicrobia bacterium]|nr:phosphohistidine phosphatase SixA [Elusimicrobiota bacterium]